MRIFISHSSKDRDAAFSRKLATRLEVLGCDVWIDDNHLFAGASIADVIEREIASRPVFVVVVSRASLSSENVRDECRWAWLRAKEDPARVILPVVLERPETGMMWSYLEERLRIEGADDEVLITRTEAELAHWWLGARFPGGVGVAMLAAHGQAARAHVQLGEPSKGGLQELASIASGRGTTGYRRRFRHGAIYTSDRGTFPVWGHIGECHQRKKGYQGRLGFPVSSELDAAPSPQGTRGRFQRFEGPWDWPAHVVERVGVRCGATVYWSEQHGAWPVRCGVGIAYERSGGTGGVLGFPTSDEEAVGPSPSGRKGCRQRFEGGAIWWTEDLGAFVVPGELGATYARLGGAAGELGFPKGPSESAGNVGDPLVELQRFEGGVLAASRAPRLVEEAPCSRVVGT